MLNVLNIANGMIMLGGNVESYREAYYWVDYYNHNYGKDVPFPNGEGFFNGEFVIVRETEHCNGTYAIVQ